MHYGESLKDTLAQDRQSAPRHRNGLPTDSYSLAITYPAGPLPSRKDGIQRPQIRRQDKLVCPIASLFITLHWTILPRWWDSGRADGRRQKENSENLIQPQ